LSGSGNPAERPGVDVHRPEKLRHVRYDRGERTILDLDTGDRLKLVSPFRESPGHFVFSNEGSGFIAQGSYFEWNNSDTSVYEITAVSSSRDGELRYFARTGFDISTIAALFRAALDAAWPDHGGKTLVVDARPATPADMDPKTGSRV
jgi:hypothetical protein